MTFKGILTEAEFAALPAEDWKRKEFKQGEDKRFYADLEPVDGWEFQHIEGLKATARTERERREKWEKEATDLKKAIGDMKPEEVAALKTRVEEMKLWTPDDKVKAQIASIEKQYADKVKQVEDQTSGKIAKREAEIRRLLVDASTREILSRKEVGGDAELLLPHVHPMVKVTLDDATGKAAIQVVDANGDPIVSKKPGATGSMTLEELLTGHFKKQFPAAYKGSGATGGGAPGTTGGGAAGAGGAGNASQNGDLKNITSPAERLKQFRRAPAPGQNA